MEIADTMINPIPSQPQNQETHELTNPQVEQDQPVPQETVAPPPPTPTPTPTRIPATKTHSKVVLNQNARNEFIRKQKSQKKLNNVSMPGTGTDTSEKLIRSTIKSPTTSTPKNGPSGSRKNKV